MVLPAITKKQKIIFLFCFLFCFFIQVIPVIRSGLNYNYGIGFWGPNGHDGVWHLSLINHISNPLKIEMPIFAGETLKNYHPFFNILIAFLSKITFIDSSLWLFQIFPVITTVLFLYLSFLLGQRITKKFSGGLILMILNSIGNSFGWIVTFLRDRQFGGESLFWAMQSPSNQLNPPFMLSILLLLTLIYLLTLKKPNKYALFFVIIFLPIIKVYSAVPAFIIFFFYVLKNKKYRFIFLLSFVVAAVLFLVYNSSSAGLIEWHPFWFIDSLIDSPDRLFIPKLTAFRTAYGHVFFKYVKLFIYYLIGIVIFTVGNFSWRILGFREILKEKAYFISILLCFLVPLLFVQKGTVWNTIQFLYYALFLSNLFLSKFLTKHQKFVPFVLVSSLLPLISFLPNFIGKIPPAAISVKELSALSFLRQQPAGIVLSYPYDKYYKYHHPQTPISLHAYETTSYLSAYSRHPVFIADEMNLENSGYNWKERRTASEKFFAQQNEFADRGFLVNNQIDYIYLPKVYEKNTQLLVDKMFLNKIFENSEILIYKVQR